MNRAILLALTVVVALGPAFGARAAGPDRARAYVADARRMIASGDVKGAIVQLRNALQSDPASGEARYVLGVAYGKAGDWRNAEQNLRDAGERGYDQDIVDAALAEALLKQERYGDLVEELSPGDRAGDLEGKVRLARGYALYGLQRPRDAERSFKEAAERLSNPASAQAGLAQVRIVLSDLPGAAELLEKAVAGDPTMSDAWLLLGKVRQWRDDAPGAVQALGKAIELTPRSEPARRARAMLLADTDEPAALEDIGIILEDDPGSAVANMLDAAIKARHGQWRDAELAMLSVSNLAKYPVGMYLLATINVAQGQLGQAEENITRFLAKVPTDPNGLGLKARILLARGNASAAVQLLKAALVNAPDDVQLLGMLGDAYTRTGRPVEAAAIFQQLSTMLADNPAMRERVNVKRFALGQTSESIADLEKVRALGALSAEARSFLIMAYLRNNQPDKAVAAAEELRSEAPGSPIPELALGFIALKRDGPAAARMHFANALAKQPDFIDAEINIAQTFRLEKLNDEARASFERVLKREPSNSDAILGLADIAKSAKKPAEVIALLERGRAADPKALPARLRLVEAYLEQNDAGKALAVARELEEMAPRNSRAITAIAEAQLARGNTEMALVYYRKLVDMTAESPAALLALATALDKSGDLLGARQTLQHAVELNPTDRRIHQTLLRYVVANKSIGPAVSFVRELANRRAGNSMLDLLNGDLLQADYRFREAISAYSNGIAKEETRLLVLRRAEAQFRAEEASEAINGLRAWLVKRPDDRDARFMLAGMLTDTKNISSAISELEILLEKQPDHVGALNNIALLYFETSDGRALDRAERAYAITPNSVVVADTLGWILLKQGKTERGVTLLRMAGQQPNSTPTMKYHLAVGLNHTGQSVAARAELEAALRADSKFAEANDARALLAQLKK